MESRATMNISLPESMREWIEEVVAKGGYGTVSEYIRELVRQDQKARSKKALEARLLEALESGEPRELTRADWDKLRRELIEKANARRGKRAG
jgi:antitoxin ParD1/3/4